jgi:hypothetical protein
MMRNITFFKDDRISLEQESIQRSALVKTLKGLFDSNTTILVVKINFGFIKSIYDFNLNDDFLSDINCGRNPEHRYESIYSDVKYIVEYQEDNLEVIYHSGVDEVKEKSKVLNYINELGVISGCSYVLIDLKGSYRFNLIVDTLGMFNPYEEIFYIFNPCENLVNELRFLFENYSNEDKEGRYFSFFSEKLVDIFLRNQDEDFFIIGYQFGFEFYNRKNKNFLFHRPYEDAMDYISILSENSKIDNFLHLMKEKGFDIKNRIIFDKAW